MLRIGPGAFPTPGRNHNIIVPALLGIEPNIIKLPNDFDQLKPGRLAKDTRLELADCVQSAYSQKPT